MKLQTIVSLVGITIATDAFASDADPTQDMNIKNSSPVAAIKDDKGKEDAIGSQEPVVNPAAVRKKSYDDSAQAVDEFYDFSEGQTVSVGPALEEDDDLQAAIAASLLPHDLKPTPVIAQMTPVESVSVKIPSMTPVDYKLLTEEMQIPGYALLKSLLDVVDGMLLRIDSCTDPVEKRSLQLAARGYHESLYESEFISNTQSAGKPLSDRTMATLNRLHSIRKELSGTAPVAAEGMDADMMMAMRLSMQSVPDDELDEDTLLAIQRSMEEDRR